MSLSSEKIFEQFSRAPQVAEVKNRLHEQQVLQLKGIVGGLRSLLLVYLSRRANKQIAYFCSNKESTEEIKEEVEQLLDNKNVCYFPDTLFHGSKAEQINHETLRERLSTLEMIAKGKANLIVAHATGLFKRLPEPNVYLGQHLDIEVGAQINFEDLVVSLSKLGFLRENRVEHPGEICVRGGIIDVFPHSAANPYRIEFWDDEVESIRMFDPDTQRSLELVDSLTLCPQELEHDDDNGTLARRASLLTYLDQDAILVVDDLGLINRVLSDDLSMQLHGSDGEEIAVATVKTVLAELRNLKYVELLALGGSSEDIIDFSSKAPSSFSGKLKEFKDYREQISLKGLKGDSTPPEIFYSCDSDTQVERIRQIFLEEEIAAANVHVISLGLHRGFVFPAANLIVYTDHEFYGRARRLRLPRKRFKGITLKELKHLKPGDFIVHVDYGVGIYRGLKRITVHGHERECLEIEYQAKDTVYVRIERMDRVNKFSSKEGASPKLNKLGSPEWQRAKMRTKKKIKDIARDLIEIYSKRKSQPGFAFDKDSLWQRELEASFPYDDTPDQITATVDVKSDMEIAKPMDRLICGDVGFGKTEIAVRAAFKAAVSGKQVAILVPTTILAYQHFNTFCERFANFPVRVEMMSRFRTRAEQKAIAAKLQSGELDIVIGTHRLLSKDVVFKNLGLLIVDEEHRFGVTHKEKLKRFRANIDVLTLTATPIPRTLQFSLLGARDMTHITTPPSNRLPIITEILPFNRQYIREVILRELDRDGQVFFVHNRVRSIERIARMVGQLLPEADIAVAHGQLHEKELERIMVEFVNKEYQILVSTMIIESGLDMPNVNTMIVNRADKLGLAQLYQLRGRVGRSHQRAYAYFITPPIERLTDEAIKRLRAIEEFSEIGSGSQLALRDLEIRGAGNLLGAEQTGFIDTLGFDLYNKILDEAVRELKEESLPERKKVLDIDTQVEMDFDAFVPDTYIGSGPDRVDIYRRLTSTQTVADVQEIAEELQDRFGRIPPQVSNLLHFIKIRMVGRSLGMKTINIAESEMVAEFAPDFVAAQGEHFKKWVGSIVSSASQKFEFFQNESFGIRLDIKNIDANQMRFASDFLISLSQENSSMN